jgi:hypothetical protein
MSLPLSYTAEIWNTLIRSRIIARINAPTIRIKAQSGRGNVQITKPHSMPSPYLRQYTENNAIKKELTPRGRSLLEKLTLPHLVMKLHIIIGTIISLSRSYEPANEPHLAQMHPIHTPSLILYSKIHTSSRNCLSSSGWTINQHVHACYLLRSPQPPTLDRPNI